MEGYIGIDRFHFTHRILLVWIFPSMPKPKLSPFPPTLSFHSYFPLNFSHHLLSFLGERNLELRSDLVEGLTKSYKSAGSKLESSTFHLSRAQTAALVIHSFIWLCTDQLEASSYLPPLPPATHSLWPLSVPWGVGMCFQCNTSVLSFNIEVEALNC